MKLFNNYLAVYILGSIAGVGFLYRIIWLIGVIRFKAAASDLEKTNDMSFVRLRNIFKDRLIHKRKVNDVDTYVDKMLQNWCFFGMKLSTYSKLCGILLAAEVIFGVFSILYGMILNVDNRTILSTAIVGIVGTGFLTIVDMVMDCNGRVKRIFNSVNDYLSNEYYYSVIDKDGVMESLPEESVTEEDKKESAAGESTKKSISDRYTGKDAPKERGVKSGVTEADREEAVPACALNGTTAFKQKEMLLQEKRRRNTENGREEDTIEEILRGIFAQ